MLIYVTITAFLVTLTLGSGPCSPNEDLLTILKGLHAMPSYANLTPENKVLLPELIAESQSCQLTAYIYNQGFHKVLDLLDHLDKRESHFIISYMNAHLKQEQILSALLTTVKPSHGH